MEAPKLRVCRAVDGTELATFALGDVRDVGQLKEILRERCSIPVSVQTLLHDGHPLDDAQLLDLPMELQLVLESFHRRPGQHRLDKELMDYAATWHSSGWLLGL